MDPYSQLGPVVISLEADKDGNHRQGNILIVGFSAPAVYEIDVSVSTQRELRSPTILVVELPNGQASQEIARDLATGMAFPPVDARPPTGQRRSNTISTLGPMTGLNGWSVAAALDRSSPCF